MDLGGIEPIILDDPVGVGGNMSLEAVMNTAVLFGVTSRFVPCMAAIVTFMATGCFDDRCIDTGSFFQDQTALFEDFNGCVKQGCTVSVLAKTTSEDTKGVSSGVLSSIVKPTNRRKERRSSSISSSIGSERLNHF